MRKRLPILPLFCAVFAAVNLIGDRAAGQVENRSTAAGTGQSSSPAKTPGRDESETWQTLSDCPVLLLESVDVSAVERGVLQSIDVKLNQPVQAGGAIAKLDSKMAETEVRVAKLELQIAKALAEDTSGIDFQQLALQEAEDNLARNRRISESVSESEIRRLTLLVGKARVGLIQARQMQSRAGLEAETKAAALESAQQRLARHAVHSSIDGIVTQIDKKAGQWVEPGERIAKVDKYTEMQVDALVPLASVRLGEIVGSQVRVLTEVDGQQVALRGVVTSYDVRVSAGELIRIHTKIGNAMHRNRYVLFPNMTVSLQIPAKVVQSPQLLSRRGRAKAR